MNDLRRKVPLFRLRELRDDTVELSAHFGVAACSGVALYSKFGITGLAIGGALTALFTWGAGLGNPAKHIFKSSGVTEIPKNHAIYSMVANHVAKHDGLEMPKCCYINTKQSSSDELPMAGAAGTRSQSIILVSRDFEERFTTRELNAVLAHEVEHIWEEDTLSNRRMIMLNMGTGFTWTMNLAHMMVGFLPWVSGPSMTTMATSFGALMGSKILQAQMSQAMERRADRGAIEMCHNPWALSSALNRLQELTKVEFLRRKMSNPTDSLYGRLKRHVFGTHPLTRNRKRRMAALAAELYRRYPEEQVALDNIRDTTLAEIALFESKLPIKLTKLNQRMRDLSEKIFKLSSSVCASFLSGNSPSKFCDMRERDDDLDDSYLSLPERSAKELTENLPGISICRDGSPNLVQAFEDLPDNLINSKRQASFLVVSRSQKHELVV